MTRKDYERIARVLRRELDRSVVAEARSRLAEVPAEVVEGVWSRQAVVARIARDLAIELKADNERFDMRRFFRACGLDSKGGLW